MLAVMTLTFQSFQYEQISLLQNGDLDLDDLVIRVDVSKNRGTPK